MGNLENCGLTNHDQTASQIVVDNHNVKSQYTKQITSQLKKSTKQNLPQKVQFFYIKPISLQRSLPIQIQSNSNEKLSPQQTSNKKLTNAKLTQSGHSRSSVTKSQCSTRNLDDEEEFQRIQNAFSKISVKWNSFAKIKQKSYLEDYIFIKQVGRGAYGSVCKIKMKYGGLMRAAKIIKTSAVLKQNEQKFFAEITLPMELDHPNIIKLFQVFQWKKQLVLVMQLCEGGDLFHRIKQSKIFSEKKASQIMKQILSALFYLHKKGVMHRDLKPQNMLYDIESKALKIIDFGTAIKFKPGEKMTNLVGTPYYIAPQVIKGSYDQKCDIWSCGVILYIMLCGSPPFNGKNEKQIMQKISVQPVQFSSKYFFILHRSTDMVKAQYKSETINNEDVGKKTIGQNNSIVGIKLRMDPQRTRRDTITLDWVISMQESQIFSCTFMQFIGVQFQNKLKAVVYTYIASQLYSNKDKEKLLKAFRDMDRDGDGVIGKQELLMVFNQHSQSVLSAKQVQKILQIVDTNGSGLIDFTEFLVAASNQQKILQRERLQNAFNYLDTDHSGYISIQEVKAFLDGTKQTNQEIKQIFDQVDDNGDGTISKKEFLALLLKKD